MKVLLGDVDDHSIYVCLYASVHDYGSFLCKNDFICASFRQFKISVFWSGLSGFIETVFRVLPERFLDLFLLK